MVARFVVLTTNPLLWPVSPSIVRMRVVMVVVMVAVRAVVASEMAVPLSARWLVWLPSVLVSCSECEDGVEGRCELGATSVSCMPFAAACRAADLLSRYRLYSSPRTSGVVDCADLVEDVD